MSIHSNKHSQGIPMQVICGPHCEKLSLERRSPGKWYLSRELPSLRALHSAWTSYYLSHACFALTTLATKLTHSWHRCDSFYTEVLLIPSVWDCRIQLCDDYNKKQTEEPKEVSTPGWTNGIMLTPSAPSLLMNLKANSALHGKKKKKKSQTPKWAGLLK